MSDLSFKIIAQRESKAKTVVKARDFEITIDEPKGLGGTDTAANPVEYVLAALAGCLNVMGHLIAKEMDFELRDLKIEMEGNLNPTKLFGKGDEERAGYKTIVVKMMPECDASKETLEKWLHSIEERCPVCDNLRHTTNVEVGLGDFASVV